MAINMSTEKEVVVSNQTGLHARPASMFVQKANQFASDIRVHFQGKTVNAKSIIEILTLGAGMGSKIKIEAEGEDAGEAVRELVRFVEEEMSG